MHARGDTSNNTTGSTDDGASGPAADMKDDTLKAVLGTLKAMDAKLTAMEENVAKMATKDDLKKMEENMAKMAAKDDLKKMATKEDLKKMATKDDLSTLEANMKDNMSTIMGSYNERIVRYEAKKMFGESFAKPFRIKCVHDVVHLITKARYKELLPGATDGRTLAANKLAERANVFAVPLAKVFVNRVAEVLVAHSEALGVKDPNTIKLEWMQNQARDAFESGNVENCLQYLMGACKIETKPEIKNLFRKIEWLKKGFEKDAGEGDVKKMFSGEGPGIMLLQLASKFLVHENMMKQKPESVIESLHYEIEMDLRGSINLVCAATTTSHGKTKKKKKKKKQMGGGHAVIAVGEAKSSIKGQALTKAKDQIRVRLDFLKYALQTIFENKFGSFILVGHIFVPLNERQDNVPSAQEENGVAFHFYRV